MDSNERLARLEERVVYIHNDTKEIKKMLGPVVEKVAAHETNFKLLSNDKKWMLLIVGTISGSIGAAFEFFLRHSS